MWLIYFAAAFGLAYIIGHAKISFGLRLLLGGAPAIPGRGLDGANIPPTPAVKPLIPVVGPFLADLMECLACSGFWIGVASSFWLPMVLGSNPVAWSVIVGCATSGMNYVITGIIYKTRGNDD
jgi:hypothetical protein